MNQRFLKCIRDARFQRCRWELSTRFLLMNGSSVGRTDATPVADPVGARSAQIGCCTR